MIAGENLQANIRVRIDPLFNIGFWLANFGIWMMNKSKKVTVKVVNWTEMKDEDVKS